MLAENQLLALSMLLGSWPLSAPAKPAMAGKVFLVLRHSDPDSGLPFIRTCDYIGSMQIVQANLHFGTFFCLRFYSFI